MRTGGAVTGFALGGTGEAGVIAVGVSIRTGDTRQDVWLVQFADPRQLFTHDFCLELHLGCIVDLLPFATATDTEIFATGLDTRRSSLQHLDNSPTGKIPLLLGDF